MIQSMTGYGKATVEFQGKKIVAELRSLNSKSMDLNSRICPAYREREMEYRATITHTLERGKVDFNLWFESESAQITSPINGPLLTQYYKDLIGTCDQNGLPHPVDPWMVLMRLPDVIQRPDTTQTPSDEEWQAVKEAVEQALAQLVAFRGQEGKALSLTFEQKIQNIGDLLAKVEPFERQRIEKIRQRIEEGLQAIPSVDYDHGRLEQEMIYYIEKLDVSEEKQRLRNHLKYFIETMQQGHGQGKKLGFIAQEMGREINTLGSKSNLAEMQNIVVMMKDELEQIKEQVLNVM